jgi:CubicO group peptidase (beta-lactamase class C family)
MTIKHLLTHTSGLIYGDDEPALAKMYKEADLWSVSSLEEFTRRLARLPLASQPGTQWHYGVSMDVLGRLVEVLSGQRFDRFLAEHVFGPLGMVDTGFVVPEEKRHRFAALYQAIPQGRMERVVDTDENVYFARNPVPFGGHGLVSTPVDYLRFTQMLLDGGELEGVRILGRKTVDFMMMNHLGPELGRTPLAEAAAWYQFDAAGLGYGLTGAVVTDAALGSVLGSSGIFFWGGNASTHFWIDREEDLIGMVFTQLTPSGTYPMRSKMRILTYQALIE